MNTSNLVIDTYGLSKKYGAIRALKPLDLKVARNSIFGFLGPNGAGKTTTIKLLLGLTRPTTGGGTMCGFDIVHDSLDVRRKIGYLAQNPHFYEHMTARETLRFRLRFFYRGPKAEIEQRIQETLILVGLDDKADRPIRSFSGGELQRLGIGLAQVNYPELLILDEPAASLDPQGRRDVLEVMNRLRKHATIFYCTHILDDVQQVSDSVAILNHGELVAQAPLQELLTGSEGPIYHIVMEGDARAAQTRLESLPWVAEIKVMLSETQTAWQVLVTDEAAAKSELLPMLVCEDHLCVLEFGRKKYELEDIFLSIVEGGKDVKQ
ncbi:MAG: ABC transporter ATP-binding protein [Anaerolineales bacterium]|nr:ABC transporter ATP-binding protein [Anaerolineales bacterium]